MSWFYLASGLVLLIVSGDFLVRGATALAARYGLSPLLIALTIVAFGTSAPELLVSVRAALAGVPGIALGNVVGSNIANILLILGLPALIMPIACVGRTVPHNMLIMMAASVLLIVLCFIGPLGFWQGILLLSLLAAYLVYSGWDARMNPHSPSPLAAAEDTTLSAPGASCDAFTQPDIDTHDLPHGDLPTENLSRRAIVLKLLIGLIGLPIGARFVVDGGTEIAQVFGVSDAVIGLSLIAVGTSLPELATSLMAVFRRNDDVVVGNIIGSNIMNILAILGVTALIAPLPVSPDFLNFHLWVMLGSVVMLLPFTMTGGKVGRGAGILFLLAYGAYLYGMFFLGHAPGVL
ncbi:MAG: sodium:proton exchanger [Parvibaculum sp.]|nr:sodium:proton exchanger [Parvibaculum sp.]HCX65992.1 sodium:proton exchanger [Rhodobiaceae bacterium]|tara:strand:- start:25168 stop:26214 length:1047 start_codon:yes stop_codon:yes gene_type:complete